MKITIYGWSTRGTEPLRPDVAARSARIRLALLTPCPLSVGLGAAFHSVVLKVLRCFSGTPGLLAGLESSQLMSQCHSCL
jgi:hypothetical protein